MDSNEVFEVIKDDHNKITTSYVCSLGRTAELAFEYFPSQTLFLDCMGSIISTSIGIALGLPTDNVVALDTDGSNLMGITVLSTLSSLRNQLANLTIIVFDNEILESCGGLKSRYSNLDWQLLGLAWEINITVVEDIESLKNIFNQSDRLKYIVVKVKNDIPAKCKKNIDGIESKYLFTRHIEKISGKKLLFPAIKN